MGSFSSRGIFVCRSKLDRHFLHKRAIFFPEKWRPRPSRFSADFQRDAKLKHDICSCRPLRRPCRQFSGNLAQFLLGVSKMKTSCWQFTFVLVFTFSLGSRCGFFTRSDCFRGQVHGVFRVSGHITMAESCFLVARIEWRIWTGFFVTLEDGESFQRTSAQDALLEWGRGSTLGEFLNCMLGGFALQQSYFAGEKWTGLLRLDTVPWR
uniref:(northern house mosquito) hypothetical protein n=1 Tax=Culex pipiens TaxID=7175 RepID=A0A8D8GVX9_CULPI